MIIVSNAHAYQAVTALFTATGPRAAAAVHALGLYPEASFAIRKTSQGDFAYLDTVGEEKRFTLHVSKDGTAAITTVNGKPLPE
jgi:hypothetical protein